MMFDELIRTTIYSDGKAEVEVELPPPTPEQVERAVAEFVRSARNFARVNGGSARFSTNEWWQELQWLACADADLKTIFCGRDRSPRSIQQYHKFRLKMIEGKRYRANA